MRIAHCCLANFYIDGASYQENLLPKTHKRQGHEVMIVASTENYLSSGKLGYVAPSSYVNDDGIPVLRLPYRGWMPHFLARKLRTYKGLDSALELFAPDIIFLHDLQFIDAAVIRRYAEKHPRVKVFVDGHTDHINSARTWISDRILHRIIYRWCASQLIPVTTTFWGVTPLRAEFMANVYGIPLDKLGVLVMGFDDEAVDFTHRNDVRTRVRARLGIHPDAFVVITGGRLEPRKQIDVLMRAIRHPALSTTTLLIFGSAVAGYDVQLDALAAPNIRMLGWQKPRDIYDLLLAADLACFPGTHSVLWEQAVGVGVPCVFHRWRGVEHVELNGNCLLLDDTSEHSLVAALRSLVENPNYFASLSRVARERGPIAFSYDRIARVAIGESAD